MSVSEKVLRSLQPKAKAYQISDGHGLSIRVSPHGLRVFQYRYLFNGKPQRMDLGTFPLMGLDEARAAHFQARKLLDQNINPLTARNNAKRANDEAETVEQLAKDFITRKLRRERKAPEQAEQVINANVVPLLGKLKVKDVTRRDVVKIIEKVVDRGAPVMANRTTSIVKQMFKYAVIKGLIDVNPCAELTRTSIGGPEKPRTAYLLYKQIWRLWHGLEKAAFSETLKICIKILLATGQRRSEVMRGRWSHVHLDRNLWIIPAELSKNGKQHVVHLAPLVANLFLELKTYTGTSAYFVPSPYGTKDVPMSVFALNTAMSRIRDAIDVENLSPHMLRHTVSTQMSAIGVAPHVVEKILNHSLTGMLAVYNHHQYYAERAEAFQKWALKLLEIVAAPDEESVVTEPTFLDAATV